jgi:hypothetical protein
MRATLSALVLLAALNTSAGTITSVDPSTLAARSGEYFLTVLGTGLGNQIQFDGPAGHFVLDISAADVGYVIGWIPLEVVSRPGTYTVTILGGQSGDSGPATLKVIDPNRTRPPFVLHLPEAVMAVAQGKNAVVRYDVSTTGGEDGVVTIKCDPPSGSVFRVGTTGVNCTASNAFGDSAKGNFTVFVHDATLPVLKLPGRITVPADAREGSFVRFEVSANDEVDGVVEAKCDAKSGSLFPVGVTTVNCFASDLSFNTANGTFLIDVVDKETPLELHLPDPIYAEAENKEGAKVSFDVFVTGSADPAPRISCDPKSGSLFPIGETLVYCKATDAFGKSADGKFRITVSDTTPPAIDSAVASPSVLDASGGYAGVVVDVKASDAVDPSPRCSISTVYANETIGEKDWSIVSAFEVKLKATTTSAENRVYHVLVNCFDEAENVSTGDATVTVISKGGESGQLTIPAPVRRRSAKP